jgi:ATP-dependent helicase/nuclease subunit A
MLDWLGPVAAAAGEDVIRLARYTSEQVAAWRAEHAKRPQLSPQQSQLARLEPLENVLANPVAAEVIERLEFQYPFDVFTRMPAADAVTIISKNQPKTAELTLPRFLAGLTPNRADVGAATHRVLVHLDFTRPSHGRDLKAQIREMIDRRLISESGAALVDCASVEWLIDGETGRLLQANALDLRREVPIHFPMTVAGTDGANPLDRVMIRGRIDLLVPTRDGIVLIDFKTDDIPPEAVPARANLYEPQLRSYREAVETIATKPVIAARLVFLTSRVVREIK